jgi:hypothetical protein
LFDAFKVACHFMFPGHSTEHSGYGDNPEYRYALLCYCAQTAQAAGPADAKSAAVGLNEAAQ